MSNETSPAHKDSLVEPTLFAGAGFLLSWIIIPSGFFATLFVSVALAAGLPAFLGWKAPRAAKAAAGAGLGIAAGALLALQILTVLFSVGGAALGTFLGNVGISAWRKS